VDAKSNANTATPTLAQTNAYKLLHAMAIDCRSAVKGSPIAAAETSAYRSDLYFSQSEWQGLGSEDRAELEKLMATAFPDRRWAVHAAIAKSVGNCLEAPIVMASKPTASELAAEAKSRQNMEDGKFKATRSCQRAIADILNDPDSAKYLEDEVVISDGRYLVTQAVRGKNAFGGMIKNTFQCVVLPGTFQAAVLPR
jgi:hypothetical protein